MKTKSRIPTWQVLCLAVAAVLLVASEACLAQGALNPNHERPKKVVKSELEWKRLLTAEEYRVLRQKGTERAYFRQVLEPPRARRLRLRRVWARAVSLGA
jgi:hypothetical protein